MTEKSQLVQNLPPVYREQRTYVRQIATLYCTHSAKLLVFGMSAIPLGVALGRYRASDAGAMTDKRFQARAPVPSMQTTAHGGRA